MIGTCSCCEYKNIEVTELKVRVDRGLTFEEVIRLLCRFCSHTFIFSMVQYPIQQASGIKSLACSIAWIANDLEHRILKGIK